MWSAIMSQVEGGAVAGRVFIHQSALRFLRVKIPAEVMAMVMLVGCLTLSIGHHIASRYIKNGIPVHWVEVVAIMTRHHRSQSHPTPPPSARCQSSPHANVSAER